MSTDQLSRTFAALADPTRRAMLARLSQGEATVGQLAEPFADSFDSMGGYLEKLQHDDTTSAHTAKERDHV